MPKAKPAAGAKKGKALSYKFSSEALVVLAFIVAVIIVFAIYTDNSRLLAQKIAKTGASSQASPEQDSAKMMAFIQDLKSKAEQNPQDFKHNVDLANAYFDIQRFDQAAAYYRKAVRINAGDTNVLIDLGVSYFNTGQLDSALVSMQAALKINPDNSQGLYNSGIVLFNLERKDEAVKQWELLIKKHPDSQEAKAAGEYIGQIKSNTLN